MSLRLDPQTVTLPDTVGVPVARSGVRRDIQGLRALAVVLVVLSHFWPRRLPGGYVGVDVFFVISGFLITTHLLTSQTRTLRDLGTFWARRVRRLLPAASLVLLVSLVAALVYLPQTTLTRVAHETMMSAVYAENWALASSSTDYFAVDDLHTPVQHYWSLSVEEQFYIVWPLLIGAAALLARRSRRRVPWAPVALAGVFVSSLVYSVAFTRSDPARAYFVTPTRMWELALGGLVAAVAMRGRLLASGRARAVCAWTGLLLIAVAALRFTAETSFPGFEALLPTVGAALVILASADDDAGSPDRLWRLRGVQTTGDISYSIYLWHWPVVVIAPFALGHDLRWSEKLVLIAGAFLLAFLTKRFVEDPVRRSRALRSRLGWSFGVGAALMALVVGASALVTVHEEHAATAAQRAAETALESPGNCVGAAAARDVDCDFDGARLLTSAVFAKTDKADVYADKCRNVTPFTSRRVCTYGASDPVARIALVGNSHAGYWQPALESLAKEHRWQITTYVLSDCYSVGGVTEVFATSELSNNCRALSEWAIDSIARGNFDLVVTSNQTYELSGGSAAPSHQLEGVDPSGFAAAAQRAYGATLKRWTDVGTPVLVLRDIPQHPSSVPDCVAKLRSHDLAGCSVPQDEAVVPDPLASAAKADTSGLVSELDLTDRFCRAGTCFSVVGGVIAYFDQGHMSATFSKTLSPDVEEGVVKALASGSPDA